MDKDTDTRSAALKVDQQMFTETFWAKTAWTGGRKVDEPKKIAFSAHMVCVSFINDLLRQICDDAQAAAQE